MSGSKRGAPKYARSVAQEAADGLSALKLPPQAIEAEEAILGAILLEKHAIDRALEFIDQPQVFYKPEHQTIFEAILAMRREYRPIDLLTVVEHLRSAGLLIPGQLEPYTLVKLTNNVVSAAHIEAHCKIVYQKYMQRELIRAGGTLVSEGYAEDSDPFDAVDRAQTTLHALIQNVSKTEVQNASVAVAAVMDQIAALEAGGGASIGVPTPFDSLNALNHGWVPTDLVIVAARPSVGKTAFALNLAYAGAMAGAGVAIFSLEMGKSQLMQRVLSHASGVYLDKLQSGKLGPYDKEALQKAADQVSRLPLFIDDDANLKPVQLKSKVRRLVDKHRIKLVIIDYIQLMSGNGDKRNQNREQEISEISRQLKILAKEMNITVIALSQLSRGVEQRSENKPRLSELRESGAIEQDADEVYFLYRPTDNEIAMDANLNYVRHLDIAKDRDGQLANLKLAWYGATQSFMDEGKRPAGYVGYTQTNALTTPRAPLDDSWDEEELI